MQYIVISSDKAAALGFDLTRRTERGGLTVVCDRELMRRQDIAGDTVEQRAETIGGILCQNPSQVALTIHQLGQQ